ncbi:MAG: hypothetical protein LBB89_09355 [Treponema sp.]|nr:hypothetical protein [Treponema sp.]
MNKKTLRILGALFLLFFVAGIAVVSAQTRAELNEAYEIGYNRGYRDCRRKGSRYDRRDAINAAYRDYPSTKDTQLREKFLEGYNDGWGDKLATFD